MPMVEGGGAGGMATANVALLPELLMTDRILHVATSILPFCASVYPVKPATRANLTSLAAQLADAAAAARHEVLGDAAVVRTRAVEAAPPPPVRETSVPRTTYVDGKEVQIASYALRVELWQKGALVLKDDGVTLRRTPPLSTWSNALSSTWPLDPDAKTSTYVSEIQTVVTAIEKDAVALQVDNPDLSHDDAMQQAIQVFETLGGRKKALAVARQKYSKRRRTAGGAAGGGGGGGEVDV